MIAPELNTFAVFVEIEIDATATELFAKSVAHHSDWLHRQFMIDVLRLHRDDSVVVFDVLMRVFCALSSVLRLDLCLAVENNVEVGTFLRLNFADVEPAGQDCQLVTLAGDVSTLEEGSVFRSDLHASSDRVCEVLHKQMLAKWRVSRLQLLHRIEVIDLLGEDLLVHVDEQTPSFSVKLLVAKWIKNHLNLLHLF